MAINGSELLDKPWDTIFSPFTELLTQGFFIIPVSVIACALYIKTRNPTITSSFLIVSGIFLSTGAIFSAYPEMITVYALFTTIGIMGLIVSLFFMRK